MFPPSSRPQPPRYNLARDRHRIAWLVFLLGLIIVLMHEASKPKNWHWLTGTPPHSDATGAAAGSPPAAEQVLDEPLAPDEVRIVAGAAPRLNPGRAAALPEDMALPAALLADVNDAMVGVRRQEAPAYFAALAKARDVPLAVFQSLARVDLTYAALVHDPQAHRGQILALEGELRWFQPMEAGENDLGLTTLYEGYLFTEAAGRTNPYRIVCVARPDGFPQGADIRERVFFAGYFFKRYSYATAHGMHSAPMLIGPTLIWHPQTASATASPRPLLSWALTLTVLALALVWCAWRLGGARRHAGPARAAAASKPVCLPADLPVADPNQFLAGLRLDDPETAAEQGSPP